MNQTYTPTSKGQPAMTMTELPPDLEPADRCAGGLASHDPRRLPHAVTCPGCRCLIWPAWGHSRTAWVAPHDLPAGTDYRASRRMAETLRRYPTAG